MPHKPPQNRGRYTSGDFIETGALTPSAWLSPMPNRIWLKSTTASAPITPAAKQIAARWLTVKTAGIAPRSFSVVDVSPRCWSQPVSNTFISDDILAVFIRASVVLVFFVLLISRVQRTKLRGGPRHRELRHSARR